MVTNNNGNITNVKIKMIFELALILISAGMVWATLNERVKQNTCDINTNTVSIIQLQKEMMELREKTVVYMGTINGDLREMRVIQNSMDANIQDIKRALNEHAKTN